MLVVLRVTVMRRGAWSVSSEPCGPRGAGAVPGPVLGGACSLRVTALSEPLASRNSTIVRSVLEAIASDVPIWTGP